MKFAHMADCHIGSYRDERMKHINMKAFETAVTACIEEKVDFVLIAGDLFNTSLPSFESLKSATRMLKKLSSENISVYIIPGSHDFSPSGKTMLDVLEEAGLCKNVVKGSVNENGELELSFSQDENSGAKITGMLGKRGTLEKSYYENLSRVNLEDEEGFKIFMFHSAIDELKPKKFEATESTPISYLPKGFNYYAGGHVHIAQKTSSPELGGVVSYPGPLFPNSFSEIEELSHGGFYIFDSSSEELLRYMPIKMKNVRKFVIDAKGKSVEDIMGELRELDKENVYDSIVLIRLKGKLNGGKVSEIDLKSISDVLYQNGAYVVLRNTSSLTSELFEEMRIQSSALYTIEKDLLNEHSGQMTWQYRNLDANEEKDLMLEMLELFDVEKAEGETQKDFEERVYDNASIIFEDKYSKNT